MLLFLYGPETLLARRKLREIIERYGTVNKKGVHLRRIDCSAIEPSAIETELQTNSLFKEKKLLILENVFENSGLCAFFLDAKKKLLASDDIIVFFQEGPLQKTNSFCRFLQKNAKTQEFPPLKGPRLSSWIEREFQKYHVRPQTRAVAALQKEMGSDLWRLSNEIKKLAAFGEGFEQLLSQSDPETDIFGAINALRARNKKRALELLSLRLEKGDHPLHILSMLSWYARTLVNPRKMHEKILQTDLAIKTGRIEPAAALLSLVAAL